MSYNSIFYAKSNSFKQLINKSREKISYIEEIGIDFFQNN